MILKSKWTIRVGALMTSVALGGAATWAHGRYGGWRGVLLEARLLHLKHVAPLFWPQVQFTQHDWRGSPEGERYRFAKSVIASGSLVGRTRGEVAQLLGGDSPGERA